MLGNFDVDDCYEFKHVTIKSFSGAKYLSLSERSSVVKITDIGEVVDTVASETEIEGEIIGVISCETYNSCRSCKGKAVETHNQAILECTKCAIKIKATRCDIK